MFQTRVIFVHEPFEFIALVDDRDYNRLWFYYWKGVQKGANCYYAYAIIDGQRKYLHRMVMGDPPGKVVDHIDGWRDCRRRNLRVGSTKENLANRRPKAGSSSRFKGVSRSGTRWQAQIQAGGKNKFLGRFDSEEDAAKAYDVAARQLHGEWAWQNFR